MWEMPEITLNYANCKCKIVIIIYRVIIILIAATVIVDERNDNGWTGLMLASRYGHANAIKIFLEKGFDTFFFVV